jgi:hypothetical protein
MLDFTSIANTSEFKWGTPNIYFIIKGYLLYIGETQRYMISRWGEHLSIEGTFTQRALEFDPECFYSKNKTYFYGFSCSDIVKACDEAHWKRASRYLEHSIHLKAYERSEIAKNFKIISDTSRSAPSSTKYSNSEHLSEMIIERFISTIQKEVLV